MCNLLMELINKKRSMIVVSMLLHMPQDLCLGDDVSIMRYNSLEMRQHY